MKDLKTMKEWFKEDFEYTDNRLLDILDDEIELRREDIEGGDWFFFDGMVIEEIIDLRNELKKELEGENKMKKSTIGIEDIGLNMEAKIMQETIKEAMNNTDNNLYFAKVESNATIPSKRDEDAGYDIYTCETETIIISPCSTRMIDTGIAIACSNNYFPKFFDKGGMGSKGIIVGAGVGDSGYRDKYFIPLINTNQSKWVVITNQSQNEIDNADYFDLDDKLFKKAEEHKLYGYNNKILKTECIIKPLNKAITQFVMLPVPKLNVKEITYEELKNMKSERKLGKMGSSGK